MTNEEIKKILDGAPEGATHYQSTTYLRYDSKSWLWWSEAVSRWCFVRDESIGWAQVLSGHHGNLDDLREILELRQEVERLQQRNAELEEERDAMIVALCEVDKLRCNSWEVTGAGGYYKINSMKLDNIFWTNPQQSLNALKREVARESVNNFAHRLVTRHIDMIDIYTWAGRFLDEALDKYPTKGE